MTPSASSVLTDLLSVAVDPLIAFIPEEQVRALGACLLAGLDAWSAVKVSVVDIANMLFVCGATAATIFIPLRIILNTLGVLVRLGQLGGEWMLEPLVGGSRPGRTTLLTTVSLSHEGKAEPPRATQPPPAPGSSDALSESSMVTPEGVGPVKVGMTLSVASAAAGQRIVLRDTLGDCGHATPEARPDGLSFMTIAGRVARVEVTNRGIRTAEGAQIGMSESEIRNLYPDVEVAPGAYDEHVHYLIVRSNGGQSAFVFETDSEWYETGGEPRVRSYRAGREPEVEFVEGCT